MGPISAQLNLSILIILGVTLPASVGGNIANALAAGSPSPEGIKHAVEQAFGPLEQPGGSPSPKTTSRVDVYIDASASMAGYVQPSREVPGAVSHGAFLRSLRAALVIDSTPRYFRFGDNAQLITNPETAEKLRTWYNERDTSLAKIVKGFASTAAQSLPKASIVVTDGVQSNPQTRDFVQVAESMGLWIQRDFYIHLLAFRASFSGAVFSEILGGTRLSKPYIGPRPFYALIFSVSPTFASDLAILLRDRFNLRFEYLSLRGGLEGTTSVTLRIPPDLSGTQNPLGIRSRPIDQDTVLVYWRGRVEEGRTGFVAVSFSRQLRDKLATPQISMQHLSIEAQCVDLEEDRKLTVGASLGQPTSQSGPGTLAIDLMLGLRKVVHRSWAGCRLPLVLAPGGVSTPSWVSRWSTDRDRQPSDFSRTLYLQEMVATVLRKGQSNPAVMGAVWIGIAGAAR